MDVDQEKEEMIALLILCREAFMGLPRSLGYEYDFIPKIDAIVQKHNQNQKTNS